MTSAMDLKRDLDLLLDQELLGIAEFPNIFLRPSSRALRALCNAAGAAPALWGDLPPTTAHKWIALDEPSEIASRFSDWLHAPNSHYVWTHGWHAKLGQHTFVTDARVPPRHICTVFEDTFAHPEVFSDTGAFVRHLLRWIPALKWVYTPLSDEIPIALIVAHHTHTTVVRTVAQHLSRQGIPFETIAVRQ